MNLKSLFSAGETSNAPAPTEANPFAALQHEIDRLFSDFGKSWPTFGASDLTPRMDVTERENEVEISAELPGMEQKDVEITLSDDVLTIRGEKKAEKEEKAENRHIVERSYGLVSRSVQLPSGIKPEDIQATMANGVLKITLPKPALAEQEPKRIDIKTAA
jgi:HSP20 family protein